jgi:hypothetical protein
MHLLVRSAGGDTLDIMPCPVYETLSKDSRAATREADRATDPGAASAKTLSGAKLAKWRTESRAREAAIDSELQAHLKSCAVCLAEGRPEF